MAILVKHQIAIVAVFDLQKEHEQAVACHGHDKVASGTLVFRGVGIAVLVQKVPVEIDVSLAANSVT